MSSLQKLSMKLNRHANVKEKNEDTGTSSTLTGVTGVTLNTADYQSLAASVQEQGNHPNAWLDYIKQMHAVAKCMTEKEKRYDFLSGIYSKAIQVIPEEFWREESYGKILIYFAKLRAQFDVGSAEMLFKKAISDCRQFAYVHLAAAEFYSKQGDVQKARRVLEKSLLVYNTKPAEQIRAALAELREKTTTTSLRYDTNTDGISLYDDVSPPQPEKPTHTQPSDATNPHFKSFSSGSRSSCSDDGDSLPIMKSINEKPEEDRRPLRSYHSTPDCKTAGSLSSTKKELSGSLLRRKKIVGRAMRIPVGQLPQVAEKEDHSKEDEDEGIKPLVLDSPRSGDTGYLSFPSTTPKAEPDDAVFVDRKFSIMDIDESNGAVPSNQHNDHNKENIPVVAPPRSPVKRSVFPVDHNAGMCSDRKLSMMEVDRRYSMMEVDRKFSVMEIDGRPGGEMRRPTSQSVTPSAGMLPPQPVPPQSVGKTPQQATGGWLVQQTPSANMGSSVSPYSMLAPCPPQMMQTPMGSMCNPLMQQNPQNMLVVNGKPYQVMKLLGTGGSSKVYEAYEFDKNRLCAIKKVDLNEADDFTVQSYKNEINLLKRLQYSEHIVKMFDHEYCESTNTLYVVMERGETDLAHVFKNKMKRGGISHILVKFYWAEMLQAVHVLHREGIVHSDLKPSNFLLVSGNVKLIDFGIASAIQQDKTSVTREAQIGTLSYMSPEAIFHTSSERYGGDKPRFKLGVKSDVWSLGCILYNMVYKKTPFQHIRSNIARLHAIGDPNVPIAFTEVEDKNLMQVLKACLNRDPKLRPGIDDLLQHAYLKQQEQQGIKDARHTTPPVGPDYQAFKQLVMQLSGVESPNSVDSISKNLLTQLETMRKAKEDAPSQPLFKD